MSIYPVHKWDSRIYILQLLNAPIPDINVSNRSEVIDRALDKALLSLDNVYIEIRNIAQKVADWRAKSGDNWGDVYETEVQDLSKRLEPILRPQMS